MIAPTPLTQAKPATPAATAPPADPAEAFARHAAQLLGPQLVACEERFPAGESDSILIVVVERDAVGWRERLKPAYEKLLGNSHLAAPEDARWQVVDRSTEEAICRLCDTGLLQMKIRATRHLHPGVQKSAVQLTDEERVCFDSHRTRFKRKLKMGRILAAEELLDEAREAIGEAILSAARASAVQMRLPEPEKTGRDNPSAVGRLLGRKPKVDSAFSLGIQSRNWTDYSGAGGIICGIRREAIWKVGRRPRLTPKRQRTYYPSVQLITPGQEA